MPDTSFEKLKFPRLRAVTLERFSLYAQQPDVELTIRPGVFCLAGGNGIGKSTFLAAVNFAITGRVPNASQRYSAIDDYYRHSSAYAERFFDGRIVENDRDTASITVEMTIGETSFELTRGLFEPDGLRRLHVANRGNVLSDSVEKTDSDRQVEYAGLVTSAMGLRSFDQFVFLQHFVLTFDEARNLLFWNEKALQSVLFLAFGADPQQQISADKYRQEMDRSGSNGRNSRFHALRVKRRIDQLKPSIDPDESDDGQKLFAQYDALVNNREQALKALGEAEAEATDAEVDFATASAALITARSGYAQAFGRHLGDHSSAFKHPLVLEATVENRCAVCGTVDELVAKTVAAKINVNECPFCGTTVSSSSKAGEELRSLEELDKKISEAKQELDTVAKRRDRLTMVLNTRQSVVATSNEALQQFEKQHSLLIVRRENQEALARDSELRQLEAEYARLLDESKSYYVEKDKWRDRLVSVQQELEHQYQEAEKTFVPLFRQYAEEFIGMRLDVLVEFRGAGELAFVIDLQSSKRRLPFQLSESQRFFLDIALRMALASFMSSEDGRAGLFIDTPEGSLDIAYESRAGAMFASFAKSGHDILMTANINTSELLHKLAADCGRSAMTLVRMTEWADLTEVQLQEKPLFEKAYSRIEEQLRDK